VAPNSTLQQVLCVAPGCYVFTITDSYGDGICCDYGQGGYVLSHGTLGELASGGDFTYEEESPFCIGSVQVGALAPQPAMRLRPNPAQGMVEVVLPEAATGHLRVCDGSGRVVALHRVHGPLMVVPLHGLAAGTYLVEHIGPDGRQVQRLLVR
jgi:hypothetical protein